MRFLLIGLLMASLTACGPRGAIRSACLDSDRSRATPSACSCIQGVANQELSGGDRRRAAKFFTDPDLAQQTRARDDSGSEAFWRRYRAFATKAEARCG